MNHTHCPYDSSRLDESERLTSARKVMKDAWIGLIIVSVIFSALFGSAWWSLIPRILLFIHAIEKTSQYSRIKEQEKKLKAQQTGQNNYANTNESSYYGKQAQPTVTIKTPTSHEGPSFCPLCGSKHERNAVYCSACGTDLKLGA